MKVIDVVNRFNRGDIEGLEFEIRFKKTTRAEFENLLAGATKQLQHIGNEHSIIVFGANDKMLVKCGEEKSYREKKRIAVSDEVFSSGVRYAAHLSSEKTIDKIPLPTSSKARLKNRSSYRMDDWQVDFTVAHICTLSGINSHLKSAFFQAFENIPIGLITEYSVEIEWIGKGVIQEEPADIVQKLLASANGGSLLRGDLLLVAKAAYGNIKRFEAMKKLSVKTVSNAAIAISKLQWRDIFPPIDHLLTDKADGVRAIAICRGPQMVLLTDTRQVFKNEALSGSPEDDPTWIVDCEKLDDKVLAFDVIVADGKNVASDGMLDRVKYLADAATAISNFYPAEPKQYTLLGPTSGVLQDQFTSTWETKKPYPMDGLIISTTTDSYVNTKNYKWKPAHEQSIDFMIKEPPKLLLGKKPFVREPGRQLWLLFVGINYQAKVETGIELMKYYNDVWSNPPTDYFPIQFSPSLNPLAYVYQHDESLGKLSDGDIVELYIPEGSEEWHFKRVRTDRKVEGKYFGNDFKVAEIIYQNYSASFDFKELYEPSFGYFSKAVDRSIYGAKNHLIRYAISQAMLQFGGKKGPKYVIDLAAGRGADIHRYTMIGVDQLLAIDIDADAISELVQRKHSYGKDLKKRGGREDKTTIHAMVRDLTLSHEQTIELIGNFGFLPGCTDLIVCNLALHYFAQTADTLANILKLVSKMLKPGGVFLATVMNGEQVFDLLKNLKHGEQWTHIEDNNVKYAIERRFAGQKLAETGQLIAVKMPFSSEMLEEPLLNITAVTRGLKKEGLELEMNESIGNYVKEFEQKKEKLSPGDKHYVSMHNILTWRKLK